MRRRFPFIEQVDSNDCAIACYKMVAKYYLPQSNSSRQAIDVNISKQGITLAGIERMFGEKGFQTLYVTVDYDQLLNDCLLPSVALLDGNHYAVVHKVSPTHVWIADPAIGKLKYSREEFCARWTNKNKEQVNNGLLLLLEPTEDFFGSLKSEETNKQNKFLTRKLIKSTFLYKKPLFFIFLFLLLSGLLSLLNPLISKSIFDYGIKNKSAQYVIFISACQITFFTLSIVSEFIQSWLAIQVSTRTGFKFISDFLIKLTSLPMSYFNSKSIGDLNHRIDDNKRIESFLNIDMPQGVVAVFSIIILNFVLFFLSKISFFIYFVSSVLELSWIFFYIRKFQIIDKKGFAIQAEDQNKTYEILNSIQDIKLNNLYGSVIYEWKRIQKKIFRHNTYKLQTTQFHDLYKLINYSQYSLIICYCSLQVIRQQSTLGTLLAIIFILSQLNTPTSRIINFLLNYKLVKVSLERFADVYSQRSEDDFKVCSEPGNYSPNESIYINNLSFSYIKDAKSKTLKDVSFSIPHGKVTAIVGTSGSGKTTLLKLLLKLYKPDTGGIIVGDTDLSELNNNAWRSQCGTVLQDSYIYGNTIAYNIALSEEYDEERMEYACQIANISEFINSLAVGIETKIGSEGSGISQGQRQRILIARTVYKDPDYIFLDEATNSLDADNEKIILNNLEQFYNRKTVVIVAHRLSTVKNADQIIVLHNGEIIEYGTHQELISTRKNYFNLIKNQLEIGG